MRRGAQLAASIHNGIGSEDEYIGNLKAPRLGGIGPRSTTDAMG